MEERHEREQYFFDQPTLDAVADLLEPLGRVCLLCAPMVGVEMEDRGCDSIVLDLDERFSHLRGFRRWDIYRPTYLAERFDVIFADPPFFNVSLSQLFAAIRLLSHHDFSQRVMVGYLTRRANALLATFAPFGLRPTGIRPTYKTVDTAERNKIELFANFQPAAIRPGADVSEPDGGIISMDQSEIVEIAGMPGGFELRGGEFDMMLLWNGAPVILNWCDCQGSVGQYLKACGRVDSCDAQLQAYRRAVNSGFDSTRSIADQIGLLLNLFVAGRYQLELLEADDWELIGHDTGNFYPYPANCFVATRARDSLDGQTIEAHAKAIGRGERPIVVVATVPEAHVAYVIDGHHKLQAYRRAGVPPRPICITALKPPPVDLADGKRLVGGWSTLGRHYVKWKKSTGAL